MPGENVNDDNSSDSGYYSPLAQVFEGEEQPVTEQEFQDENVNDDNSSDSAYYSSLEQVFDDEEQSETKQEFQDDQGENEYDRSSSHGSEYYSPLHQVFEGDATSEDEQEFQDADNEQDMNEIDRWISNLPLDISHYILEKKQSALIDAAQMSLVSKYWWRRWLERPEIVVDDNCFSSWKSHMKYNAIEQLFDQILRHRSVILDKLEVTVDCVPYRKFEALIGFLSSSGIRSLIFKHGMISHFRVPKSIWTRSTATLTYLELHGCEIVLPWGFTGFKGLENLSTLKLDSANIGGYHLKKIIIHCRGLTKLELIRLRQEPQIRIYNSNIECLRIDSGFQYLVLKECKSLSVLEIHYRRPFSKWKRYAVRGCSTLKEQLTGVKKLFLDSRFVKILDTPETSGIVLKNLVSLHVTQVVEFNRATRRNDAVDFNWVEAAFSMIAAAPNLVDLSVRVSDGNQTVLETLRRKFIGAKNLRLNFY